jgi:hypothetical protein
MFGSCSFSVAKRWTAPLFGAVLDGWAKCLLSACIEALNLRALFIWPVPTGGLKDITTFVLTQVKLNAHYDSYRRRVCYWITDVECIMALWIDTTVSYLGTGGVPGAIGTCRFLTIMRPGLVALVAICYHRCSEVQQLPRALVQIKSPRLNWVARNQNNLIHSNRWVSLFTCWKERVT